MPFTPTSMENLVRKIAMKARVILNQQQVYVEPNTDSVYAHYRRAGLTPIADHEIEALVSRLS